MTTVTTHDLMLALLAMDSYNRGGDNIVKQFITNANKEFSSQIGDATFKQSSDRMPDPTGLLTGSTNAGFSASYYTWNNETVIAYRGTDFGTPSFSSTWQDIIAGWSTSFNLVKPDTLTGNKNEQPYYAERFYKLVTGIDVLPGTATQVQGPHNIELVGHSLGGSLAGFIGALTGITVDYGATPLN